MREKTAFRKWASKHKMTAKEISEKTGISFSSINCYFQGVRTPNRKSREKLRKIGVDTLKIFGE